MLCGKVVGIPMCSNDGTANPQEQEVPSYLNKGGLENLHNSILMFL
jgi:hypothetical protein